MSLLILAFLGVLLYTPTGSVVTAAVTYYVTPAEPPSGNPDSPPGKPCETLDHCASNTTGYFASGNDNVTMIFLSGNHMSKSCFNFSCPLWPNESCLNLTMLSLRHDTVKIWLECDIVLSFVNILTVNRLTIHGNERHGIVLREVPVVGMAVDGVMFIGAALRFGGHLSSNILLKNTTFEASIIEMNFTSPDWVNIYNRYRICDWPHPKECNIHVCR